MSATGLPPAPAPAPPTGRITGPSVAATTAVFVRLKLSLLRNGTRQSTGRSAAFVGSTVLAALVGALGLLGLVALRGDEYGPDTGVVLVAMLALGWAFLPLFVGVDETLDPGRLAMLPLRPSPLLVAQLASGLVGSGPLFTLLLVVGAVLVAAHGVAAALVAVVAAPLVLVFCVTLTRALATANARLLTSRRGRDLAVLSGLLVAFGLQGLNLALSRMADEDGGLAPMRPLADVLGWLPPASAVRAVRLADEGSAFGAVLALATTAGGLALLLWWWRRTLTTLLTAPDASSLQPPAGAGPDRGRHEGGLAGLLPTGRTGTVMLRVLRYAWRDPKAKMGWATSLGMAMLLPLVLTVQDGGSVYTACWAAGMLGLLMYNQFGGDYSGFWLVAATIGSPRDAFVELRARMLVICLLGLPLMVAVVLGTAALFDDWESLPTGLGLTLAMLGALLAVGAMTSAWLPYSIPQEGAMKNVAPGQSGLAWGSLLGGTLVGAVLVAPVGALALFLHGEPAGWLVVPVGAVWGAALCWGALRLAARRTADALPEILAAVSKG
ncbi:ABC-2 type transport system permease protein [Streptomyces zhaozhouensis]|uniref:ABC-2 type transport system permease protein n=1 Tax=Streptomyces zhaozhouensis TaxID=1300267 RepID=A0A286DYA1_9ACTN|nr:transporter [Streptomyces zhaozhouensis]SOD63610.1 ABC-2 type transport system permease protein [Streptomyces zhaozhouensis]